MKKIILGFIVFSAGLYLLRKYIIKDKKTTTPVVAQTFEDLANISVEPEKVIVPASTIVKSAYTYEAPVYVAPVDLHQPHGDIPPVEILPDKPDNYSYVITPVTSVTTLFSSQSKEIQA